MSVSIRIPELGESITEALIVRWLKEDGAEVRADEPVVEIETEKSAMDVAAEGPGRLAIRVPAGTRVRVGTVIGEITEAAPAREERPGPDESTRPQPPERRPPAPNGAGGRRTERAAAVAPPEPRPQPAAAPAGDGDERVPMSELRRTIARRLVEAQRQAAILTTFNEIDVGELQALRARSRERFKARHGVDLGLVSLFARAVVLTLREFSILNASIEDDDVVHHRHVHLGIAVSTPRGLVVPVVREADRLDVAGLERAIGQLAARARATRLAPGDLEGGTFTITNGGVFGSLLSTPILNPPQSGILGMHAIQPRPVARDGQVVIRPMMYVALSYDHRLVDGAQAVSFLVRLKELLEDPARMALDA
jgi:2-oxoglutarate dehydrogenase E2 component (dihydrolipoamide succinyltransferase)